MASRLSQWEPLQLIGEDRGSGAAEVAVEAGVDGDRRGKKMPLRGNLRCC